MSENTSREEWRKHNQRLCAHCGHPFGRHRSGDAACPPKLGEPTTFTWPDGKIDRVWRDLWFKEKP